MFLHRQARSLARSACGLLVSTAVMAVVLGHSDPVRAQTSVTTCVGSAATQFSPGLTLVPRATNVTFSETFGSCTSTTQPAISSATVPNVSIVQDRSCATAVDVPADPITQTITWNTGQTTTFQYTRVVTNVGGVSQITGTGMVTDGLFQGASVVKIVVLANLDPLQTLACLSPNGLTSVTGTDSLTFTQL